MPDPDWRARIRGSRLGNLTVLAVTALAVLIGSWLVMRPGDEAAPVAVSKVDVPGQRPHLSWEIKRPVSLQPI